jgi:hypothetical protein
MNPPVAARGALELLLLLCRVVRLLAAGEARVGRVFRIRVLQGDRARGQIRPPSIKKAFFQLMTATPTSHAGLATSMVTFASRCVPLQLATNDSAAARCRRLAPVEKQVSQVGPRLALMLMT